MPSRRLAEALGGSLEVSSTIGQRSTFTVELPAAEGPVAGYNGATTAGCPPARPLLILLDLHLSALGGDDALRRLWDDPVTASIPVVMVSTDAAGARYNGCWAPASPPISPRRRRAVSFSASWTKRLLTPPRG